MNDRSYYLNNQPDNLIMKNKNDTHQKDNSFKKLERPKSAQNNNYRRVSMNYNKDYSIDKSEIILKNNIAKELENSRNMNANNDNLLSEFELTNEINNNKPSLRDLINSAVKKQQKKSKLRMEEDVS